LHLSHLRCGAVHGAQARVAIGEAARLAEAALIAEPLVAETSARTAVECVGAWIAGGETGSTRAHPVRPDGGVARGPFAHLHRAFGEWRLFLRARVLGCVLGLRLAGRNGRHNE